MSEDHPPERCNYKGCAAVATVKITSSLAEMPLLPVLYFSCDAHASKVQVGGRFRQMKGGELWDVAPLRNNSVVNYMGPLDEQ